MTGIERRILAAIAVMNLATVGCESEKNVVLEKRPRPVVATVLRKQQPPDAALVAASAGSWKTEQIGFEVDGRVAFVVEQNTEIDGRIRDSAGKLITAGTAIAKLESERFSLQVAGAEAEVSRAQQDLNAAQTDLDESIPAQIAAATASRTLAETDYARSRQLLSQNAGSQAESDQAKANYDSALAEVRQLEAAAKSKQAEIESLKSAVLQAEQSLREAERDLEDCTLYSSFRGQIAETSVVPGSVVQPGEAIVTLQMMDPIKVELEVSAEESRQLQRTEVYPVHVTMPSGEIELHKGYLYQIDSIADPRTRTYTLTLLVINKKLSRFEGQDVATTRDVWRLNFDFLTGAEDEDALFVEEHAILRDAEGFYLWQITNATVQSRSPTDNVFEVRKIRVTLGSFKLPYLGNWVFQEITVNDDQFDPQQNLVIGELFVAAGTPEQWNGHRVYVDSGSRWMLRPGDLVKVDLSKSDTAAGYYVPIDAIARRNDQSAIFVLVESGGNSIAKRIPVRVVDRGRRGVTSSLCRIEPIEDFSLDGIRFVTTGTHYLVDGEPVNAVSPAEAAE